MREKDCKIVRDLLPNYVENLTEKETNQYIEEHLKECKECQEIQESMKREIKSSQYEGEKKKIDGLKKYHTKLKLLKSIVIVILLIFIFHVARNMIILSSMQNKRKEYKNCDNFSFKYYAYNEEGLLIREFYKKREKVLEVINHNFMFDENDKSLRSIYVNGEISNSYFEANGKKKWAELNRNEYLALRSTLPILENEWYVNLLMSMCSFIRSEKCNNVDCYKIYAINEDLQYGILGGFVTYMEKETGLVIRQIGDANDKERTKVVDWEYNFDVPDKIFVEPDVSEYEVVQNGQ